MYHEMWLALRKDTVASNAKGEERSRSAHLDGLAAGAEVAGAGRVNDGRERGGRGQGDDNVRLGGVVDGQVNDGREADVNTRVGGQGDGGVNGWFLQELAAGGAVVVKGNVGSLHGAVHQGA